MKRLTLILLLVCISLSSVEVTAQIKTTKEKIAQRKNNRIATRYYKDTKLDWVDGSIAINREPKYQQMSPEELIKSVFLKSGACQVVENIRVRIPGWHNDTKKWNIPKSGSFLEHRTPKGMAYFNSMNSDFPLTSGLVFSTGNIHELEGPNEYEDALSGYNLLKPVYEGDEDLEAMDVGEIGDVAVIEFDFIPSNTTIEFKYIFGSEEYPEFVYSDFNDVFGFFVNKVGSPLKENIALLPTTDYKDEYHVSIDNVNNGYYEHNNYIPTLEEIMKESPHPPRNKKYFVPNIERSVATELDGHTIVLKAILKDLVPCEKYHIKLALCNMSDDGFGSAVFLEANSFDAGLKKIVGYANDVEGMTDFYKECTNNKMRIYGASGEAIKIIYEGTAINGMDYFGVNGKALPTEVIIPDNKSFVDIPIKISTDAISKSYFDVSTSCLCDPNQEGKKESVRFTIYEDAKIQSIIQTSVCNNGVWATDIKVVAESDFHKLEYAIDDRVWQGSDKFQNLESGKHIVKVRNKYSCNITSQEITTHKVEANAGVDIVQSSNIFEVNANRALAPNTGFWSVVGDIKNVVIENPTQHNTTVTLPEDLASCTLRWTITNGECSVWDEVVLTQKEEIEYSFILYVDDVLHDPTKRYIVAKDNINTNVRVSAKASSVLSVITGLPLVLDVSKPNVQNVSFSVKHPAEETTVYSFDIEKRYQFSELIVMRWNNVLTVINRPEVIPHEVISYQWYKNGQIIQGATRQSYSASKEGQGLLGTDEYYVEVKVKDANSKAEKTLRCWEEKVELKDNKIVVYPNPVSQNATITIEANLEDVALQTGTAYIYNSIGNLMSTQQINGDFSQVIAPSASGFYILRLVANDGIQEDFKIIVK